MPFPNNQHIVCFGGLSPGFVIRTVDASRSKTELPLISDNLQCPTQTSSDPNVTLAGNHVFLGSWSRRSARFEGGRDLLPRRQLWNVTGE